MIDNEIKSCLIDIPIKQYLKLNDIFNNNSKFVIGNTSYTKPTINLFCYTINGSCFKILGRDKRINYILVEGNGLINSLPMDDLYINTYVVLKDQIKNLKYVEQLNLFPEDGKDKNTNNE